MFADSHCHLEMESFDKDRHTVIEQSLKEGISFMLTVGTEAAYFDTVITLIDTYPSVYGAIGIHPHNAGDYTDECARTVSSYLSHRKIVGYGEIGLDFFKNYAPRDLQIKAFVAQMAVAAEKGLPIIVHSRNARKETVDLLQAHISGDRPGVIHCFSYDRETARIFLDLGFYISFPGTITYPTATAQADVVKYVPDNRLLAETDAPFLTPQPKRGKRNLPWYVKYTIEKIASLRGTSPHETGALIVRNLSDLFLPK